MVSAEASAFTAPTGAGIRPPRSATAYITSGTPWPRASGANLCTRGPWIKPATTGANSRNHGPSSGNHGCGARPASA